jgi:hypothetical protein
VGETGNTPGAVASGGDTLARAREFCLRDFGRCADACEGVLGTLGARPARSDVVVCAAVCRVAQRALRDDLGAAGALVLYSVEVCRGCAETLESLGESQYEDASLAAAAAAESAATLLLVS